MTSEETATLRKGKLPKGHKRIHVGKWIARNWRYREYLQSRKAALRARKAK